jgi:hypothetical protein
MSGTAQLTKEQIDKLTFSVASLDGEQRHAVREMLYRLHDRGGGTMYRESLHRELAKLRDEGVISDIDLHSTESAIFQ